MRFFYCNTIQFKITHLINFQYFPLGLGEPLGQSTILDLVFMHKKHTIHFMGLPIVFHQTFVNCIFFLLKKTTDKPIKWTICFLLVLFKVFFDQKQ